MFLSANVGITYLLELLKLRNLSYITYYWNNFCNLNPALYVASWWQLKSLIIPESHPVIFQMTCNNSSRVTVV